MLAVLEHVPSEEQAALARACFQCLVPAGLVALTVPSPAVDRILGALRCMRLIDGMALEQHYGFEPDQTIALFTGAGFRLVSHRRFELGLNNLFVFQKPEAS